MSISYEGAIVSGQQAPRPLPDNIPDHVAIIMDGNGRWAQSHALARPDGHRAGVKSLRETLKFAQTSGIKFLTIYSFSSENWKRPKHEVDLLMALLKEFFNQDLPTLKQDNIQVKIIGDRSGLDPDIVDLLAMAERETSSNSGVKLVIAFNYGARDEITRAVKSIATKVKTGDLDAADISEETISAHLDTGDIPDPDLIIRTGGDLRLSNFLLWQAAYAEFYFTDTYWPDFNDENFSQALKEFASRQRRFGDIK